MFFAIAMTNKLHSKPDLKNPYKIKSLSENIETKDQ